MIVFDDMIADMLSNKKPNPILTELFIRRRKQKHFSCFYYKILFYCTKKILDLNSTHYFIMKTSKTQELQQTAFNHSLNIDFKEFINLYKKRTTKSCSFLVIDADLASDNMFFGKNIKTNHDN